MIELTGLQYFLTSFCFIFLGYILNEIINLRRRNAVYTEGEKDGKK